MDPSSLIAAERLLALRRIADLERTWNGIVEAQALTSHDDEHDPEGATIAFERASVQGLLDGARREVEALDRAAERVTAGTYGTCAGCGRPIAAERLEALVATPTCIACAGRRRR